MKIFTLKNLLCDFLRATTSWENNNGNDDHPMSAHKSLIGESMTCDSIIFNNDFFERKIKLSNWDKIWLSYIYEVTLITSWIVDVYFCINK